MLLEIANFKKTIIPEVNMENEKIRDFDDSLDISDTVLASIVEDIKKYKDLMQIEPNLYWTLSLKLAQAHWVNCDSPSKLYLRFRSQESKLKQNEMQQIPLS